MLRGQAMDYREFDTWEFEGYDDTGWTWRRLTSDGKLRAPSCKSFHTLTECITDARRVGLAYDASAVPVIKTA